MSRLLDGDTSPAAVAAACILVPLLAVLIKAGFFPSIDPREPPLVRSKVPFIGHILGLVQEQSNYFNRLVCVSLT